MDGMASGLLWRPRGRSGTLLALRFPGTVCRFGCLAKRFRDNFILYDSWLDILMQLCCIKPSAAPATCGAPREKP
jgi:hypothetical protein